MSSAESGSGVRVRNAGRKVLATYIQHSLVADWHARQEFSGSSEERVLAYLGAFRTMFLTNETVQHRPAAWPAIVAGLGWCDQVNGAAAHMLALEFATSELVTLQYPGTGVSPHTIGRVWAEEESDWIYFDGFYPQLVVFRVREGRAIFARPTRLRLEKHRSPAELETLADFYGLVQHGVTLNRYRRTYGGYLLSRLKAAPASGFASVATTQSESPTIASLGTLALTDKKDPSPPSTEAVPAPGSAQSTAAARPAPAAAAAAAAAAAMPPLEGDVERAYLEARLAHIRWGRRDYSKVTERCAATSRHDAICVAAALFTKQAQERQPNA